MTSRERILAAFQGEETDRFPVWLKMTNPTWRSSQPGEVRDLGDAELLTAAGCDLLLGNRIGCRCERPHATIATKEENGVRTTTYHTPDGELVEENSLDSFTNSWHPTRYPVQCREDLERFRWVFTDTRASVDPAAVEAHRERQTALEAQDAVSITGVGPGPLMDMVEHWCGPENTAYLLFDHPELFEECLELMHQTRRKELHAIAPVCVADTLWMTENTSTTLISPSMFESYCMPHLRDYGQIILEGGTIPVHHMCGALNALLEQIDSLPALVNEAYTTYPLGNVSLAEGRRRMPSKCLVGGTNATLWMADPDTIVETVAEDLANCPDRSRIFLTSAGVLPPLVSLEKARTVTDALKAL